MDLWIRSQNKEDLIKAGHIYIQDEFIRVADKENIIIGVYKSKERALEVLDEIQNILKPIIINKQIKSDGMLADGLSDGVLHTYDVNEIQVLPTYVYEMPKE